MISRQARRAFLRVLAFALLLNGPVLSPASASQSKSAYFGPICIWVFELSGSSNVKTRNDLAERVASAVRVKVEQREIVRKYARKVWADVDCIKVDQPGFDGQLTMQLTVKRQTTIIDGGNQNVVVASGTSPDGLFQDREVLPEIIIQSAAIADDAVSDALVKFVDRTVVATLPRP